MKAGKYYIGDLCYVMTNDEWDQYCSVIIKGHECMQGEFELPDGRAFATYNTKFGDGVYHDQFGNKYMVDSGSIGCIRVEDIRAEKYDDLERLGAIVEMQHDFSTGRTEEGLIMICSNHIDTGGEWEEDEYDYDEELEAPAE